jgi:hypothetical protein
VRLWLGIRSSIKPDRDHANMSGKEFVAVLSTLPQDEQEMIKAKLRQMWEKRK